jgi:hypothetical protein
MSMPEELDFKRSKTEHERVNRQEPASFEEVAGEVDADRVSDALLAGAQAAPPQQLRMLSHADRSVRERAVSRLQAVYGNQYVQRLVSGTVGVGTGAIAVQRDPPPPATPEAPTPAAPAPVAAATGPSAQTRTLWDVGAVQPLAKAQTMLVGRRPNVRGAIDEATRSIHAMVAVKETYPLSPATQFIRARIGQMANSIIGSITSLRAHVGIVKTVPEIKTDLGLDREAVAGMVDTLP